MARKNIDQINKLFFDWVDQEYRKLWGNNFHPSLKFDPLKTDMLKSSLVRNRSFKFLNYELQLDILNTFVIVFKINSISNDIFANYAYIFGNIIPRSNFENNINIQYYTVGPSLLSKDGEYRAGICTFDNYTQIYKIMPKLWQDVKDYVRKLYLKNNWQLSYKIFTMNTIKDQKKSAIDRIVSNHLLDHNFLALCWFKTVYEYYYKVIAQHIAENFSKIFTKNINDLKMFESLEKKYKNEIQLLYLTSSQNFFNYSKKKYKVIPMGQKFIPINETELLEPLKLDHKPWREVLISKRASDLVINGISPSIPLFGEFFYIGNSNESLYDNPAQYQKLEESKIAQEIVKLLKQAQKGTYIQRKIPQSNRQISDWVNSNFRSLNKRIQDPITYSNNNIIMSNISLCFVSEYVGRTIYDIMTDKTHGYAKTIGHPLSVRNYNIFARYLFDICYTLYCLNTKIHVIHGDLHLNNATIGHFIEADNSILYIIGDMQFVFPHKGAFGFVIDFSRSIIDINYINTLKDKFIEKNHKIVNDEQLFRSQEINRMVYTYISMFPNKKQKKDDLIYIFKNYFSVSFKLLSAIDMYMFCSKLKFVLNDIKAPKSHIDLVKKIYKIAESFITSEMNNLIENPKKYSQHINTIDWPNMAIIKRCFTEFIAPVDEMQNICDVFIYDNNMKYSCDKFNMYPPYLGAAHYMKNGVKIIHPNSRELPTRTAYEKRKLRLYDIIINQSADLLHQEN